MSKKSIFVYAVLILGVLISSKYISADQNPPDAATTSWNRCGTEKHDYDKCISKRKAVCEELGLENTDKAVSADNGSGEYKDCLKASTDCDRAVKKELDRNGKDLYDQLHPEQDPNEPKPTADPNPPAPGDPRYCAPSSSEDDPPEKAATSTTTTAPGPTPTPTPNPNSEGCMQLSAQNRYDLYEHNLNSDDNDLTKKQAQFDKAEKSLSDQSNACYGQMKAAQTELAKAQLDLTSAQKEEMTEMGGMNVQLTQKLEELRVKMDQANTELAQINGPDATNALTAYSVAINKALADCRQNLVLLGKANQLKFGSQSEALGATSVGLTSSKCQNDFAYQQAKATAWMVYVQTQQQNQVKYMAVQAQIASLNRQMTTTNFGQQVASSGLVTKYANRMSIDQLSIKQANDDLTQAQTTCANTTGAASRSANIAMNGTTKASEDARLAYCQEQYLKDTYGITAPSAKAASDVKDFEKLHQDLIDNTCNNPCAKSSQTLNGTATDIYGEPDCKPYCTGLAPPPGATQNSPPKTTN